MLPSSDAVRHRHRGARPAAAARSAAAGLLIAAALAACTASRPSGPPPAEPTSPAYHSADAECRNVAVRETENVSPQTAASKAAIGIYFRCMTEKGFPPPGAATPAR